MTFADKIKDHPVMVTLGLMAAAYAAGWASYLSVLSATKQTPILEAKLAVYQRTELDLQACKGTGNCESLLGSSKTVQSDLPKGTEVQFSIHQMYSTKLYGRAKKDWIGEWDERCKNLASSTLVKMGFTLHPVESDSATRGEFEHVYLGVQCFSGYDHALIYGLSHTKDALKLTALSEALETRMKAQWKEFD
jgi:hypothetical protein